MEFIEVMMSLLYVRLLMLANMVKLKIKPLSVNQAWMGQRFKTQTYKDYEMIVIHSLPPMVIPEGKLRIEIEFGFSNQASDFDNPVKPFVDCLQKKYCFNDRQIYQALITKVIVKKGEEYIRFQIVPL